MTGFEALVVAAAACSLLLGALALAAGAAWRYAATVCVLAGAALWAACGMATDTGLAAAGAWLSRPARRVDLAVLLCAEVVVFGGVAVRAAAPGARPWAGRLARLPPPSLLVALYVFATVVVQAVDGVDYGLLAVLCGLAGALGLAALAWLCRRVLPGPGAMLEARLALYAAQCLLAVALSMPPMPAAESRTEPMAGRLGVLALIALTGFAGGFVLHRLRSKR
jgi:hypothetical protein